MTRNMIPAIYLLSFVLLPCCTQATTPDRVVVDKDRTEILTPGNSAQVKLNQHQIVLATLNEGVRTKKQMTVVLKETEYGYRLESVSAEAPQNRMFLYELLSADPSDTFRWGIAAGQKRLYGFRLFSDTDDTPYLAWMNGGTVCIADVSTPVSAKAALHAAFHPTRSPAHEIVPLFDLVGRDSFVEPHRLYNALASDIDIVGVKKNKSKLLTVTVANYKGDQFTFVKKDGAWRLK